MSLAIDEIQRPRTLNSVMSVPSSLSAGKFFSKEIEIDTCIMPDTLSHKVFSSLFRQHPLINTWLLLSSISICFLTAIFFIIPQ